MYGGANKLHKDMLNVNIDRDYKADKEADIALVREGDIAKNGQKLTIKKGIEVGNIFQLGYHYTTRMKDAMFTDQDGKIKPYYMGCYGIGIGRSLAALVEVYHDEKGIIWPEQVAPFKVHLIGIDLKDEAIKKRAFEIYEQLQKKNIEVLFDDRDANAGAKFADADLIGIPYRLVVSKRTGDKIEYKKRNEKEAKLLSLDEITSLIS
jgi:prolyl-tRNA synthetase